VLEIPEELVEQVQVTEDPAASTAVLEQGASALLAALDAIAERGRG